MSNTNAKTTPAPPPGPRRVGFHAALAQFDHGNLMHEAENLHSELVGIIMSRGGKGSLTLSIDYERGNEDGIQFKAELSLKKPKKARRAQFLYADKKGVTYNDDPDQPELFGGSVIDFSTAASQDERAV